MSDHDFEKRVKQKMDELKFTPSDAVWQAVQSKIRKDKPRRRGWVLIPLLLAGLGVAGYFIINNNNKSGSGISYQSSKSTKSIPQSSGSSTANDNSSTPDNASATGNSLTPETSSTRSTSSIPETSSTPGNSLATENSPATDLSSRSENSTVTKKADNPDSKTNNDLFVNSSTSKKTGKEGQIENINKHKTTNPATVHTGSINANSTTKGKITGANNKNIPTVAVLAKKNKGSKLDQTSLQPQQQLKSNQKSGDGKKAAMGLALQTVPPEQTQAQTRQETPGIQKYDSAGHMNIVDDQQQLTQQDSALVQKQAPKPVVKNDSSVAGTTDLVKSRKKKTGWDWGLNITGGISNINEGPLSGILKSSHMADAASSPQASNNFLFAPSTAGLPPAVPSEVKAGPYFSIGGFVSKQLSKTFSISAGLQYSQYNTIIEVGYLVDSSRLVNNGSQVRNVARYYRADDNSKFSNKYHFIELPLTLQTRITGSKSLPLFWNLGVNLSQMIGSDALVFDSGTGVYYKDKSTLNKTQVGFATGFTVGLFGKSKTPMLIGPSVKYNASEMFKKEILSGKHLISAGLDFRILLNKK